VPDPVPLDAPETVRNDELLVTAQPQNDGSVIESVSVPPSCGKLLLSEPSFAAQMKPAQPESARMPSSTGPSWWTDSAVAVAWFIRLLMLPAGYVWSSVWLMLEPPAHWLGVYNRAERPPLPCVVYGPSKYTPFPRGEPELYACRN